MVNPAVAIPKASGNQARENVSSSQTHTKLGHVHKWMGS